MHETAQLILDALRDAGSQFGEPAFEAAVAYTIVSAVQGTLFGVFCLAVIAALVWWLAPRTLEAERFMPEERLFKAAGLALLCLLPAIGAAVSLTTYPARLLAPEGYLVMSLISKGLN